MSKPSSKLRANLVGALVIALIAGITGASAALAPVPVEIRILSVSDWHGQLDSLGNPAVGGASILSTYFKSERAENPQTLTFTAGDAFGGSPALASVFDEEPAVKAMNLMGFSADTLGNHNFDKGLTHLQSMIDLAEFPYVSANLDNLEGSLSDVAPFRIFEVGEEDNPVKVGVVGITNPDAQSLVTAGRFGEIVVTDPVPAANKAKAAARASGADVVIALVHMGVTSVDPVTGVAAGPLVDFANDVGGFDLILGDHTNIQYEGMHNGALVVENLSKGVTYSRTKLKVHPVSKRVLAAENDFVLPRAVVNGVAVPKDAEIEAMLKPYRDSLRARFDVPMGVATGLFLRASNTERLREVALGNLIADSLRQHYGTQIAFVNGGGIRDSLPSGYAPDDKGLRRNSSGYAPGPSFDLVLGDAYTVLPFGNAALTRRVTGAQLHAVLEHSIGALPSASGRFLQISGFRFTYDVARPAGARLVGVALADGTPIPADSQFYTVATVDFMNTGGDGYTMLADGTGITRDLLPAVLADHIAKAGTITPYVDGRIAQVS